MDYGSEELISIYELGRMYFEMGFFAPAERIFNGLAVVDLEQTPARLGLGLIKLERGLYQEAVVHFRSVLQSGQFQLQAKLGLCASFIALSELTRAKSVLSEIARINSANLQSDPELNKLYEAFVIRCG